MTATIGTETTSFSAIVQSGWFGTYATIGTVSTSLSPTSYLVLGCIASAGPLTPYELKQMVTAGPGHFWTFPHSQLYSEPARLAEAGLLSEDREETGRRRRRFAITGAGRSTLSVWLADPTPELPEIRDVALLKLFFGQLADVADIAALSRVQSRTHAERAATYEAMLATAPAGAATATLRLGLAWEQVAAEFWADVQARPPGKDR